MDITSTLDTLLVGANSNQVLLDSLIAQLGAETIQSDDSELYTPPTYDEETGAWVCAQATANAENSEYLGVYTLPDTSLCSVITAVTVISASTPAAPNAPARVLPCGADPTTGWVDLASIDALLGQSFVAFSIRSATPFEVEVEVGTTWCHTFDFTAGAQGWAAFDVGATPTSGVGWSTVPGYGGQVAYIEYTFASTTKITQVQMRFSWNGSPAGQNGFIRYGSIDDTFVGGSPHITILTGEATNIRMAIGNGGGGTTGQIVSATVYGTGTNPFGTSNCS
jgi:hypothetical protein